MNDNTKATQTWEPVDRGRIAPANQRWNISLSKVALLSYRCLLAAGIIITIIIMINLDHKQYRLLSFMYHRDVTHETTPNASESDDHSKMRLLPEKHSRGHSDYFIDYETLLKYMLPTDDWTARNLQRDYAVYNPSCEIPNYTPFHKDVQLFYRKYEEINCTSKPLLTSVTRSASNSYVLNFHKQHLPHYMLDPKYPVECYYHAINTINDNFKVHEYEMFDQNVKLNSSVDGVRVTCEQITEEIYQNVHFLVPDKAEVHRKMEHFHDGNDTDESLSVMIVGFDAVSRLNLMRTMPETIKYMEKNGWYAFNGYHKIEKNTLHNLIGPVLTGHTGDQLEETGCVGNGSSFGSCPWIWNDFAEKHYITAYGEDGPQVDSFAGYGKFEKQPTDYFLRPLMRVVEEMVVDASGVPYPMCLGLKRSVDYILDFSAGFASRFVNYPTFSLFWLNSPGRVNMNYPAMVDKKFVSYLDTLDSSGALNRTMIVFMSDHGSQSWLFRQTYMGFIEDSMPFLYVWLPKWYRDKYPNKAANLAGNKFRLTSHFDLHLTLMDVLGIRTKAAGCSRCVSLFEPVCWNRRCADGGIAEESCACKRYEEICTNSTVVKELASAAVAHMNSITAKYSNNLKEGYNCSTLNVSRIISARREIPKYPISEGQVYIIHIFTTPGNGIEEAVIHVNYNNTPEVKSVTEYSNHESRSSCMNSRIAKPFCSCQRL